MPNKLIYFNDGEGVLLEDFDRMQYLRDIRELDERMYGAIIRTQLARGEPYYAPSTFAAGVDSKRWFVRGRSLTPYLSGGGGYGVKLLGGFGVRKRTTAPTLPGGGTPDYTRLLQHYFTDTVDVGTLNSNSSGNPRYDAIYATLSEASGDAESRHFEDATTRAKSSITPDKRFATAATWTILEGTPASPPAIPSVPASSALACAILVPSGSPPSHDDNGSLPGIIDYCLPIASEPAEIWMPARLSGSSATVVSPGFTRDQASLPDALYATTTVSAANMYFFPPSMFTANSCARLVGMSVIYNGSDTAATVELVRIELDQTLGSASAIRDISSSFTWDATHRVATFDFDSSLTSSSLTPLWMNGYAGGRSYEQSDGWATGVPGIKTIGLRFTKGANGNALGVVSVCWRIAY